MAQLKAPLLPHERLALITVRLFHGLPEFYVMKALLTAPRQLRGAVEHPELQLDDRIAERLRMNVRYVRTLLARLKADGLVIEVAPTAKADESKQEASGSASAYVDNAQKLYGVDFEVLADAVTYKMDAMDRRLMEQQGPKMQLFGCPKCGLQQSSLEVDYNMQLNAATGGLICPSGKPECFGVELVEEDNSDARAVVEAHRAALVVHLSGLHQALRDVHDVTPPTYKRPKPSEGAADAAAGGKAGGGGGSRGGGSGTSGSGSGAGTSLGASRGIAAAIGSGSGAQPLPPWMLSGAQAAAAAQAQAARQEAQLGAEAQGAEAAAEAAADADFMRHYTSSRPNGATPPPPNPEQVTSELLEAPLADGGYPGGSAVGGAASDSAAAGGMRMADGEQGETAHALSEEGEEGVDEEEDVEVMVQGQPMRISEVTEDDLERMTDEEHRQYYEVAQSLM